MGASNWMAPFFMIFGLCRSGSVYCLKPVLVIMKNLAFVAVALVLVSCRQSADSEGKAKAGRADTVAEIPALPDDVGALQSGCSSAQAVAQEVLQLFQRAEIFNYLQLAIPLAAQKQLFAENAEFRPAIANLETLMDSLGARFEWRMNNFLTRAYQLRQIMEEDYRFTIKQQR